MTYDELMAMGPRIASQTGATVGTAAGTALGLLLCASVVATVLLGALVLGFTSAPAMAT